MENVSELNAVIRKEVAQRIVNHLKGTPDADGAFRHTGLNMESKLSVIPPASVPNCSTQEVGRTVATAILM